MAQVRSNRSRGSGSAGRPIGVTLICALNVLGIVAALFLGFALLATPQAWVGLLMWLLIPVNVAVIVGLWRMRRWGWGLTVVLLALSVPLNLIRLDLLSVLISGIVLAYLIAIREKFA